MIVGEDDDNESFKDDSLFQFQFQFIQSIRDDDDVSREETKTRQIVTLVALFFTMMLLMLATMRMIQRTLEYVHNCS